MGTTCAVYRGLSKVGDGHLFSEVALRRRGGRGQKHGGSGGPWSRRVRNWGRGVGGKMDVVWRVWGSRTPRISVIKVLGSPPPSTPAMSTKAH